MLTTGPLNDRHVSTVSLWWTAWTEWYCQSIHHMRARC